MNSDGDLPVYAGDGASLYECETKDATLKRLRMDMTHLPADDKIDALCTVIATYFEHAPHRVVLHIRHVETSDMQPPSMASMISIAGRLMQHRDVVDRALRATIIQGTRIDDTVRVAHSLFKTVYNPATPFEVVDGEQECARHIDDLVRKRLTRTRQGRVKNMSQP